MKYGRRKWTSKRSGHRLLPFLPDVKVPAHHLGKDDAVRQKKVDCEYYLNLTGG
jgi:hypothetical protein